MFDAELCRRGIVPLRVWNSCTVSTGRDLFEGAGGRRAQIRSVRAQKCASLRCRMRVLIADDDPVARAWMTSILEDAGYEVSAMNTGTEALDAVVSDHSIRIVVLDWMMPGVAGPDICREIRARPHAQYTYVIIVSARSGQDAFREGMEAGADEFLSKPYAPLELVSRVRVAERVLAAPVSAGSSVADVMREALSSTGGELIVRQGAVVGRVHVAGGRVAWADLSSAPGSLLDVLAAEGVVSREDASSALAEARRSRRGFAEVLVQWGLVEEPQLRALVRGWLAGKLDAICALEGATAIFVPNAHHTTSSMTFAFSDVCSFPLFAVPQLTPASGVERPALADDALRAGVTELMRLDGATSAAVLNGTTGAVVWHEGRSLDREAIRGQLQLLTRPGPTRAGRELILTTQSDVQLMCPIPGRPPLFLYVVLRTENATLAMARLTLRAAADAVPPTPA